MNTTERNVARQKISAFFGNRRYVYATPHTHNHLANFYGDKYICRLSRRDVLGCVETAYGNWSNEEGDIMTLDEVIEQIIDDLQGEGEEK